MYAAMEFVKEYGRDPDMLRKVSELRDSMVVLWEEGEVFKKDMELFKKVCERVKVVLTHYDEDCWVVDTGHTNEAVRKLLRDTKREAANALDDAQRGRADPRQGAGGGGKSGGSKRGAGAAAQGTTGTQLPAPKGGGGSAAGTQGTGGGGFTAPANVAENMRIGYHKEKAADGRPFCVHYNHGKCTNTASRGGCKTAAGVELAHACFQCGKAGAHPVGLPANKCPNPVR